MVEKGGGGQTVTQTSELGKCRVYYHSSEDMNELSDETIQFALTSVDRNDALPRISQEVYRVLKPDGVFMFNFGSIPPGSGTWENMTAKGMARYIPLVPYSVASQILSATDFRLEEDVIAVHNFGIRPRRIVNNYEHFFMFTKSSNWKFTSEKEGFFTGLIIHTDHSKIPRVPPKAFDENTVEGLITVFTEKGDTVLDPCAGAGTLGKVAVGLSRNAVLYELDGNREPEIRNNLGSALA